MQIFGRTGLGILFLSIGLLLLYESYSVEASPFAMPGEMGTMTYPRFLLFGWVGLSFLYILKPGKPFNTQELRASLPGVSRVMASIIVYVILFSTVGLLAGTTLFLLLFFYLMDYRTIRHALPAALLGGFLTWFVFVKILDVVLPQAFWVDLL